MKSGNSENQKEKECDISMATLATPKKGAYVIKKSCSEKIKGSKTSGAVMHSIKRRAAIFRSTNLK